MNDKISIILPVYNVEKYLNKCIDSILNQTYKNFELIIIDDGSTDNSSTICDSYKNDSRVIVKHQDNKGLSAARNKGLDISTGKYITFIDSDDYIDSKYIEILYTIISNNNSDIVMCNKIEFKENTNIKENIIYDYNEEVLNKEETYRRVMSSKGTNFAVWAKLYRTNIFSNIKFPVGKIYEDKFIFNSIIEKAKKIVITNYNGYYYLKRSNGITKSKMTYQQLDLIDASVKYKEFILSKYPSLKDYVIKGYILSHYKIYTKAISNKQFKKEYKKIRKEILKYKKDIFKNNIYSKKEKIQTLLLLFGNTPYKIFYKIYNMKIKRDTI